jgi:hypothetical protein
MGHILRRLIAVVLLTLLLVGFAGSSALAAPHGDCSSALAVPGVALTTTDDCGSHHPVILAHPVILDHPVLNNPVFNNNRYTYNNSDLTTIYKNNTYNNNYDNPY